MFRTCNSAALVAVIVCCLGLSASLFAIPQSNIVGQGVGWQQQHPRSLTIIGQPDRLWGEDCFTLIVGIFKPRFDEDGVMLISPDIITTPFGSCKN